MNIADLLEQHNAYDLGKNLSIEKRMYVADDASDMRWFVYFRGLELHANGGVHVRPFDTALAAVRYLRTKKGITAINVARAFRRKAGAS